MQLSEKEIKDMIHDAIQEHTEGKPHHEPPCQGFLEHRNTMYGLLGLVSLLAAGLIAWNTNAYEKASRAVQEQQVSMAGVQKDVQYLTAQVTDMAGDVKALTRRTAQ